MAVRFYDDALLAKLRKWTPEHQVQLTGVNETRRLFEIVADNVSFCGSKSEGGNTAPRNDFDSAPSFSNGNVDDFSASADDDELPF